MNVDSINNGIVLDHIRAGKSMEIYQALHLDDLPCSVAIIKNVKSNRMGRKDIIKIDDDIQIDLQILGYIDPGVTINIVRNGHISGKQHLELPEKIVNVFKCKNPRCITSVEQEIDQVFLLSDRENRIYRCAYCEMAKQED